MENYMNLLNEMTNKMEIDLLESEIDDVLTQYRNIISFAQLYEGSAILASLPDDLIEKITEIERRMEVIEKAKNLLKKLEDGGWDKKKVKYHRQRLYDNRERIRKSMYSAKKKMVALEKAVQGMVDGIKPQDGLSYSES